MKKFSIPCDFNGTKAPFTIYIGLPKSDHHPIHFQSDWLSKQRGGTVPQEVMDSLSKLRDLADQNKVSFEDLCVYSLSTAQQEDEDNEDDLIEEESSEEDMDEPDTDNTVDVAGDSALEDTEEDKRKKQD